VARQLFSRGEAVAVSTSKYSGWQLAIVINPEVKRHNYAGGYTYKVEVSRSMLRLYNDKVSYWPFFFHTVTTTVVNARNRILALDEYRDTIIPQKAAEAAAKQEAIDQRKADREAGRLIVLTFLKAAAPNDEALEAALRDLFETNSYSNIVNDTFVRVGRRARLEIK
jgi:hypothetical protein